MVAHALRRINHAHVAVRTIRVGTGSAALFLTATVLAAAELIVLAPAMASLACAVVAAGLWCRWLDRHEVSDPGCPQDFLRHSLARLEGHSPNVLDEEGVR